MNKQNFLLLGEDYTKEIPNFFDYAYIVNKIRHFLHVKVGCNYKMYIDEDSREEVWDVLTEDIYIQSPEVECLGHIYDCVETNVIYSKHQDSSLRFLVKPNIENSLFYYVNYRTVLAKTIIYHSHRYIYHTFIFSENDKSLLGFYQYVFKRQREGLADYVTIFTDVPDNLDRKKEQIDTMVSRKDVLMDEQLKIQIFRSIDEFFSESRRFFTTFNIPYKRGILLYGKPGNGKTTLVKSIAGSINAPVVYWQITEYTTSNSVSEVFETAAKMAPMVLVIEDIDSMPKSVRSVFLNTLDGAISREGIFLIGTTNYPEKIDAALINRAGRFDRAYEIKLPTKELRIEYLRKKGFNRLVSKEIIEKTASDTEGFSFAQLNELFTSAALQWHYENKVDVGAILKELKGDNLKNRKNDWLSHSNVSAVGFRR